MNNLMKEMMESYAVEAMGTDYTPEVIDKYRTNPLGDIFEELDTM